MTTTVSVLIGAQNIEAADTDKYTAPGKGAWIDKFTATNYSAGVVTVSVSLIPAAGALGASNLIVKEKSLAVAETYTFPELVGHFLNPGDKISWKASAAASVNGRVSGRVLT